MNKYIQLTILKYCINKLFYKEIFMSYFLIVFEGDGRTPSRRIEFDAISPEEAFQIVEREHAPGNATLWEGDKRLGSLSMIEPGFWQLAP